jgi:hypothetical protein
MFNYLSTTNIDLADCAGFPLSDAWLLATKIVARICKSLNTVSSELRDLSIKLRPPRNTAHILYVVLHVHYVMDE